MIPYPYIWFWKPSRMRTVDRKDQRCRVLVRGKMNSALIEFEDGFRVVASRNALRRKTSGPPQLQSGYGVVAGYITIRFQIGPEPLAKPLDLCRKVFDVGCFDTGKALHQIVNFNLLLVSIEHHIAEE